MIDASAMSVGSSLNEYLCKGPQMTPLSFYIFLCLQTHLIAITSIFEKSFLQISANKGDQNYLRFLWFDDVYSEAPNIVWNRFAWVVFGVISFLFFLNETYETHGKL